MRIGNGLAWRLSVYRHGLGWHEGCLFIAMAHTLALGWHGGCLFIPMAWAGMGAVCLSPWLTHWHSHTAMGWHGGCLFIAMTHKAVCLSPWLGLAWRLPVYHHGSQGCLFIAMAWAGMEAVCLSPWLTHWHSHTGIYTLAFNEVPMGIGMVEHWHLKRFHWALGWPGDWHLKRFHWGLALEEDNGI